MRRLARLVLGAALTAGAACSSDDATLGLAGSTGRVDAARVAGGVEIANGTDRAIAYVAYDPHWLGLLAACAEPDPSCLRLPAGRRVVVPESEVAGWEGVPAERRRALSVRWWRVGPAPAGGYVPVDVHEIRVVE
jgi:hypothetical protein